MMAEKRMMRCGDVMKKWCGEKKKKRMVRKEEKRVKKKKNREEEEEGKEDEDRPLERVSRSMWSFSSFGKPWKLSTELAKGFKR